MRVIGMGIVAETVAMSISPSTIPYLIGIVRNMEPTVRVGRVSSKGQVTIPKRIREALDIRDGDALQFRIEDNTLTVSRIGRPDELAGSVELPEELKGLSWKQIRALADTSRTEEWQAKWHP